MRRLIIFCALIVLGFLPQRAWAADRVFEGPWKTTNRKLDGTMRCFVTDLGNENWQGRFVGTWQGVPFDYTVKFTGPPNHLHGTATIDGADYSWAGELGGDSQGWFKATFTGNRYSGNFDLKEEAR